MQSQLRDMLDHKAVHIKVLTVLVIETELWVFLSIQLSDSLTPETRGSENIGL